MHRWINYQENKRCANFKVRAYNDTCHIKYFTFCSKLKVKNMAVACCEDQAAMIVGILHL